MLTLHKAGWIFDAPDVDVLRGTRKGALAVDEKGTIAVRGEWEKIRKIFPKARVVDHGSDSVITPGFVDGHVHAPQMEMVASAGHSLLEWLEQSTFPTEAKYSNLAYAAKQWTEFCQALLRAGTTSAAIYATSDTESTKKLLETVHRSGLRAHVGKVLMDRNAPKNLLQPAEKSLIELDELINGWKKKERVMPAITVRFAPTSTEALLRGTGELIKKHPELLVQTHLGETQEELLWVKELFPKYRNYAEVYFKNGIMGPKTLLGHCIYLNPDEINLVKEMKSHVIQCPSSNFFLGSGLFPYEKMKKFKIPVGLGSDVGAGWDLSMQNTARCCYEAQALQKYFMKPGEILHLATRAGCLALHGNADLGLLAEGYGADFVIHDLSKQAFVSDRAKRCETPDELLSVLLFLGGEATIKATYVDGKCQYARS